jgi:hypothetical protein
MQQEIPPDATPISTEQLFAIIGEQAVQIKVLQGLLRNQLEKVNNGAIEERSIQSKDN